ncbi:MAG: glycosyltransferase family 39 protein [Candidatus Aureabacteria bacterium]|nr:glycosyltransferase family 39 protein [Candidatus Auribacterota bacterium]
MKNKKIIILLVILLVGFFARIGPVNKPLLGNFSSYQAATAIIGRFIAREGPEALLYPKTNFLIYGQPALHMLYVPGAAFAGGMLWKVFSFSLDFWGRFQASFFTMLSALLIYLIIRGYYGEKTGLLSCFIFNVFPLSFVYGQSFMNEAFAFFCVICSFWILSNFKITMRSILFSGIFAAASFLMRIHFLCVLPALVFVLWQRSGKNKFSNTAVFIIAVFIPVISWYLHTYNVASSMDSNITSIFAQKGKHYGSFPHPLLLNIEFYKYVIDSLGGICLNPAGFVFMIIGLAIFRPENKIEWFIILWLLGSLGIVVLLPQKIYDHNFYFYPILFPAALLISNVAIKILKGKGTAVKVFLGVVFIAISARYFINPAFSYPAEMSTVLDAGRFIRENTPADARIIVSPDVYDQLYYCDRYGWTFDVKDDSRSGNYFDVEWLKLLINCRIRDGADFYVSADLRSINNLPEFVEYLDKNYENISPDERFVVYVLTEPACSAGRKEKLNE